LVVVS
jgi:hypothetical protein